MGTSGGEPRVLLNALKPMLGVVGDIRTPQEVMRVVGMMKDAEKLMSRCIYLNILKATCRQAMESEVKRDTLDKFLTTGGWGILNKWLHEFTKSENFPVLLELIDVLRILPITVELLKQGNTGKLIKQMTKLEHPDVKKNAGLLIRQWKDMIRGGPDKKLSKENENGSSVGDAGDISTKRNRETEGKGPPEKKTKLNVNNKGVSSLVDSSGFMNALNAVAAPAPIKKKRRSSDSKTTLPLDEILNRSVEKKQKVEENTEKNTSEADTNQSDPDASTTLVYISPAVEAANQALAADTDSSVVIDEGSLARKKNKKKRNITWAIDENLVEVRYFEVLEHERKRANLESFSQARQHELMLEKQAMRSARRGEDNMLERVRWSRLIPVDNAGVPNFVFGEKSREKYLQAEREKSVLAFIFLTRESLPDNPTEPDFDPDEHSNRTQPRMIPHDEDGTIYPVARTPSTSASRQQDKDRIPTPTTANNTISKNNSTTSSNKKDVSPTVQNIMNQLFPQTTEQSQNPLSSFTTNMTSSMLVQKPSGNIPPPPSNNLSDQQQQQRQNKPFNNNEDIPPMMGNNQFPNQRGRGGLSGPRFRGGPPPGRGRGNFNPHGGPGGPRWDGQPGPDDWNQFDNNYDNHNDSFNDGYNDFSGNHRGGGNFRGAPPGRNNSDRFNENYGGFRRGGPNRNGNDRGRNGGPNSRIRGDWNNDGNDNFDHDRREGGDWNRGRRGGRGGGGPPRNRDKSICQHFQRGNCRNGDRCNFVHI